MSIFSATCGNCEQSIMQVDDSRWWHTSITKDAIKLMGKQDLFGKLMYNYVKLNSTNTKSMDLIGALTQYAQSKLDAEEKDINLFKKYTDPKFSGVKNSYGNVGCHAALFETDKKAWESGKVNKNLEARPRAGSSKKIA